MSDGAILFGEIGESLLFCRCHTVVCVCPDITARWKFCILLLVPDR